MFDYHSPNPNNQSNMAKTFRSSSTQNLDMTLAVSKKGPSIKRDPNSTYFNSSFKYLLNNGQNQTIARILAAEPSFEQNTTLRGLANRSRVQTNRSCTSFNKTASSF